eukprot:scaffold1090_cov265-Pinguiococcus_pyrenoidosus.AAC.3
MTCLRSLWHQSGELARKSMSLRADADDVIPLGPIDIPVVPRRCMGRVGRIDARAVPLALLS